MDHDLWFGKSWIYPLFSPNIIYPLFSLYAVYVLCSSSFILNTTVVRAHYITGSTFHFQQLDHR